ncbi:6-carboxytetrahydropterin synthase QueD [Pseudodesulfovibrio indicus]|uniref:6-carboxytetrahydropterin synthase QueD n=1 Tax=Pseudodesulfovibrio indicus TaxID=1716143 RepID=UPI00098F1F8F|nr:6-carboxytetrahydropterin synthase QueD [Pseudodesulfovibrio indicus]
MDIYVTMTFDAAHKLPNVPDGHKCSRLHGHSFGVDIHVSGDISDATGWVVDFSDLKAIAAPVIGTLDHNYLNDIPGLDNPTSENIAIWIWDKLKDNLPGLSKVVVKETPSSGAIYSGKK